MSLAKCRIDQIMLCLVILLVYETLPFNDSVIDRYIHDDVTRWRCIYYYVKVHFISVY